MNKILIFITFIFFVSLPADEISQEQNSPEAIIDNMIKMWTGDLDAMIKDRVIRVLVMPSKNMFWMDKGKKSGFSYEYMMLFEKEINKRYSPKNKHLKTRVIFIPVSKDQLIPALLKGRGDIAMGDISITPKRKRKIDFSDPFVSRINAIVVTGPSAPALNSIEDLSGKEIYVHTSSSYQEYLEKMNFYLTEVSLAPIKIKKIPELLDGEEILKMVNIGLIKITVIDDYVAKLWSKIYPKITLHENLILKENDSFGWMIRKKSPLLKKEVNHFIKNHKEGTLLGNTLMKRYVGNFQFEEPAITEKKMIAFNKVVDIFKKYAKQYELNYLLMISQAYQESKLNQKAKSHVGAIGVMQLMPATGKSMKVGNIKELDPNIHAGIKYHRWIIDHYFKNSDMDVMNQTFFAFASYNAGPNRIRKLRKIAKKRGYNPDVWFNNVEVIAAEKIGAETVTYVSNIYEYYVAYYLYKEKEKKKQHLIESK